MGFYALLTLMKDLRGTIPVRVWDGDTFEGSGGTRLPKPNKATAFKVKFLKDMCLFVMGVKGPEANTCMLTLTNLEIFAPEDMTGIFVVDCTDEDLPSRRKFREEVKRRGAYWMRGNYDGDGTVVIAEGLPFTKSGVTDGNYNVQPSASVAQMAGGALATAVLKFTRKLEYTNYKFQVETGIDDPSTIVQQLTESRDQLLTKLTEGVNDAEVISRDSSGMPNVQVGPSPSEDGPEGDRDSGGGGEGA